jgi:ClpP class serine protease
VHVQARDLAKALGGGPLALNPRAFDEGGLVRCLTSPSPTALVAAKGQTQDADRGSIAMVDVRGPLAQHQIVGFLSGTVYIDGYDAIAARVSAALADPKVGALVLRVESPGGAGAGLEEAIGRMRAARDAAGKPIYVYVDEQAASAAYWIASALGDGGVFVPQAGHVGSIGVISMLVDESAALEKDGFKVTLVREPEGKAESHPYQPIADLSLERVGAEVKTLAGRFYESVARSRDSKPKAVRALNGNMFGGQVAVDEGLADGVASLEQVVEMASRELGRRKTMKDTKTKLGLPETATDAEVQAALDVELADAKLGRSVRARLGATTAAETEKRVDELVTTHQEAEAARVQNEQELKARAKTERNGLVAKLVQLGKETPATAWVDPTARELEPKGSLATMPLEELRERVATFEKEPRAAPKKPERFEGAGLTEREIAKCKAKGLDPQVYAKTKAEMNRKSGARAAEAS